MHPPPEPTPLPRHTGHISVAANGRYFQDEAGRGFVVIGQNDAITWPGLEELLAGNAAPTEAYIADLRDHGVTVSRIMMEYAQRTYGLLEDPVGVFSPRVVRFWDNFLPIAERHNLYLLLTPYDTFWQVLHWRRYPYNKSRGGPCGRKSEWLTTRACIDAHKRRWEFIIRRWGGSSCIFAWDIMNEIDLYWSSAPDQIAQYVAELAGYIRGLEQQYWGRTHLITVSSAASVPQGELGEVIYNHPDIDFVTTHLYAGEGVKAPTDTVEGAIGFSRGVAASLDRMRFVRPYFDSESGPIDAWIIDYARDTEYHRNMSFAHLAAGGAGSGMRWPYSNPHQLLPRLRDNLRSVARFAAAIDWRSFNSHNINNWIVLERESVISIGCGDESRLVLWFLSDWRRRNAETLQGAPVEVRDILRDGAYRVELWDTEAGACFEAFTADAVRGRLAFQLNVPRHTANDVAVSVYAL